ncbi:MAG: 1-acyl-sn-glycerol-3-phosphate acyltransferase [Cyclobacteriaceae bacterium]
MLYTVTKSLVRLAIHGFFRKIHLTGKEHFPTKGACILIVNHPSALIDPLIIASITNRRLHYIAAAEYFGKGLQASMLKNEYNMIPVYRPQMYEGQQVHNDDMFRDCYDCLAKDGIIVIFPEGNSVTEKHLRPLKTGVGRILMGMKKAHPDKDVPVIPIGLNYDNAHRFQSEMLASIGPAITFSNLKPGSEESEKEQIIEVTEQLHASLKKQILHFENRDLEPIVERILKLYRSALLKQLAVNRKDKGAAFRIEQKLIEAATYLHDSAPDKLSSLDQRIKEFLQKTRDKQLDFQHNYQKSSNLLLAALKLLIFSPFFILGTLINGLPFLLVRHLFKKVYLPKVTRYFDPEGISPAFVGTIQYSLGAVIYFVWFLFWSVVIGISTVFWAGPLFFAGAYLLGRFAVRYAGWFISFRRKVSLQKALKKHANELPELIQERASIIDEFVLHQKSILPQIG